MKKVNIVLMIALLGITLSGCRNDEAPTYPEYDLVLVAPDDGITVDLAKRPTVNFGYNEAPNVNMYVLALSRSEDLANPQNKLVTANPQPLTTDELDAIASALGIQKDGETATVYWTIRPNSGAYNIKTQVRTLQLTRATTPLQYPIDGQVHVIVGYPDDAETALTFEWANHNNAQAQLVVGKTANLSDGIVIYSGTGTTKAFTHAELQNQLIEHAPLGLKRYFKNTLYWNVKIGGTFIGEMNEQFFLSGQRALVDVRNSGREVMVYPVAVIETDDYTAAWMGRDLKTEYMYDGASVSDNIVKAPPSGGMFTYNNLATIAPGDYEHTGYYYQPVWGTFLMGDDALLTDPNFIPAGWTIPAKGDFDALFAAANNTVGDDALRDPVVHDNLAYGAWGLNFYVNGFVDNGSYVYEPYGWYHWIKQESAGWTYAYFNSTSTSLYYRIGTLRLKYIGN
jgi:hypothetical protein